MRNTKREKVDSSSLLARLIHIMNEKGDTRHELADELGLSYIHVTSLLNGVRDISGLDIGKQRLIANYMSISFAQFYIYLGVLLPDDFIVRESSEDRMKVVFETIEKDPAWGAITPSAADLAKLPHKAGLLIALMYEQLTKQSILERVDLHKP